MPGFKGVDEGDWLGWTAFGVTLYAGLTMVTNVPFYSFKDVSCRRIVPFIVIVADRARHRRHQHPPAASCCSALFVHLRAVGLRASTSGSKAKGRPVSVIATSTDEPDETGPAPLSVARATLKP